MRPRKGRGRPTNAQLAAKAALKAKRGRKKRPREYEEPSLPIAPPQTRKKQFKMKVKEGALPEDFDWETNVPIVNGIEPWERQSKKGRKSDYLWKYYHPCSCTAPLQYVPKIQFIQATADSLTNNKAEIPTPRYHRYRVTHAGSYLRTHVRFLSQLYSRKLRVSCILM